MLHDLFAHSQVQDNAKGTKILLLNAGLQKITSQEREGLTRNDGNMLMENEQRVASRRMMQAP